LLVGIVACESNPATRFQNVGHAARGTDEELAKAVDPKGVLRVVSVAHRVKSAMTPILEPDPPGSPTYQGKVR